MTGDARLVAAHGAPLAGSGGDSPVEERPAYDPTCYLCPSNARAGGVRNPDDAETFVFENDYAALRRERSATGAYPYGG